MRFLIIVLVTMLSTIHAHAQAQDDQARQARQSRYMEKAEVRLSLTQQLSLRMMRDLWHKR
jgi:hypothetical protein